MGLVLACCSEANDQQLSDAPLLDQVSDGLTEPPNYCLFESFGEDLVFRNYDQNLRFCNWNETGASFYSIEDKACSIKPVSSDNAPVPEKVQSVSLNYISDHCVEFEFSVGPQSKSRYRQSDSELAEYRITLDDPNHPNWYLLFEISRNRAGVPVVFAERRVEDVHVYANLKHYPWRLELCDRLRNEADDIAIISLNILDCDML